MLLTFVDGMSGDAVAVNPNFVVCVFKNQEDGKTIMHMSNGGNIVVEEDYVTTVGQLQGELK